MLNIIACKTSVNRCKSGVNAPFSLPLVKQMTMEIIHTPSDRRFRYITQVYFEAENRMVFDKTYNKLSYSGKVIAIFHIKPKPNTYTIFAT